MTNAYQNDKPMLPYIRTTVEMAIVILYLQKLNINKEIKRTSYILFRNESANGHSGVNNNYCGFQADSGRWDEKYTPLISGVVSKAENGTGKTRLFLAFNDVGGCLSMLTGKIAERGLYVGGRITKIANMLIITPADLCSAYQKSWVTGNPNAIPSAQQLQAFLSMYAQAAKLFP